MMTWFFSRTLFGVFRFIATGISVAWALNAVPLWTSIRKNSLPQSIPHRREIYLGQSIAGILVSHASRLLYMPTLKLPKSILLPIWMGITAFRIITKGSLKQKGHWVVLYCTIDCGLIGLMIASLVWQSSYLPGSIKSCPHART